MAPIIEITAALQNLEKVTEGKGTPLTTLLSNIKDALTKIKLPNASSPKVTEKQINSLVEKGIAVKQKSYDAALKMCTKELLYGKYTDASSNMEVYNLALMAEAKLAEDAAGGSDTKEENLDSDEYYDKVFREKIARSASKKGTLRFDDIAGLGTVKQILHDAVVLPLEFSHMYNKKRTATTGLLMYGPPGTGKTLIAKACAADLHQCSFLAIGQSDVKSPYQGQAVKKIQSAFRVAKEHAPCIIFIDECENLAADRSAGNSDGGGIVQELLTQMQGADSSHKDSVLVIGATNIPDAIDSAILRRFQTKVMIDLPDEEARKSLILTAVKGIPHDLAIADIEDLAEKTNNYSGSDLSNLVVAALQMEVPEVGNSSHYVTVYVMVDQTTRETTITFAETGKLYTTFTKNSDDNTYQSGIRYMPAYDPGTEGQDEADRKAREGKFAEGVSLKTNPATDFIPRKLTTSHLDRAFLKVRPSFKIKDMAALNAFTEKFGYKG